jgi:CubicO group peptidase (beta-lactamase class C family)
MREIRLERAASPEEAGICSAKLAELFRDFEKNDIKYHSFMVIKGDKVAFESYTYPYSADTPHAMYSASKSVTSTAIGFAVDEGLLSLDTLVADVFPEYAPKKPDERLGKLKVRHLLSMTSGKNPSLFGDRTGDWAEYFLRAPWYADPGAKFRYINENIYMLCAILVKVTGMSVTEYLESRLWQPLGIKTPVWERDPNGIEAGGWGLYLTPEDFAKLTLCYKDGGVLGGRQVIPKWWVEQATSRQADNSFNKGYDSNYGYGYCFWMNAMEGSFRMDGMFGQFGMVFPGHDACIVITAGHPEGAGSMRKCLWKYFPDAFDAVAPCENQTAQTLAKYARPEPKLLPCSARPQTEKDIDGKIIRFSTPKALTLANIPLSILPMPIVFLSKDRGGNINNIRLDFEDTGLNFSWTEGSRAYSVKCGLNGEYISQKRNIAGQDFTLLGMAAWTDDNTLEIWIKPLEAVALRILRLTFKGRRIRMRPASVPAMKELFCDMAESGLADMFDNKVILSIAKFAVKRAYKIFEPKLKGKFL